MRATPTILFVAMLATSIRPAAASAQLRGELSIRAPACIDGARLRERVAGYLGRAPFETPHDVAFDLRVDERDGRLAALLTMSAGAEERGRRVFHASAGACRRLEGEIALVLALLLETGRREIVLHIEEPSPGSQDERETSSAAVATHVPGSVAVSVRGHALGIVTVDLLPGVAAGARLGVAIDIADAPPIVMAIEGHGSLSSTDSPALDGGALLATASLCPALLDGALGIELCAGVGAGALATQPRQLDEPIGSIRAYVDLRILAALEWRFAPEIGARLEVGTLAPMLRDRFLYRDLAGELRTLHEVAAFVPYLALGVALGRP